LRARSISPNSIVGVCLERGIGVFQAFLAILKAGGAYLPLDVTHPSERIRYMIEDSGAKIIITDEKNLHLLGEVEAKVICLDRDREEILNEGVYDLPCVNAPEDLAYVIYTSGSTGRPKGSGIPHRAVNRLVCNNNYLRIKEGDRIAQVTNTSFDLTTFEVWGALLNGGCLVILPQEILLSPSDFAGAVLRERIDVLCIATSLFNHIASSVPGAFQGMRDVIFGGEAAAPDVIRKVLQAGGPKRLLNGYGPTENTTWTTYYPIESCSETTLNIPIGRPVSNTKVYILDRWLQLVPVGVPGEVYNAGEGLARDYLNHPSMTAEKFLPDPFGGPGERMYRTGDKGRYLPDGNIEFLGRIDQQIKLRGFRVELGEIEALLDSHDSIKRSVVVLVDPHSQTKQLVAYLVFQPGHSMDINDLRAYLGDRLPTYMIPNLFVSIPALPLTPNGKLDRKALPPPSALELSPGIEPPESVSALERVLLQIWSEVLDRPVTSLQANFFELGGYSLLGIRLLHQISSIFDVDLSPRLLYVSPTVKELASVILKIKNDEREIDKIAQTLLELKNLSDERVFEMLGDLRSGKAEN
jgi:amino acid adenylation domain-containing protein